MLGTKGVLSGTNASDGGGGFFCVAVMKLGSEVWTPALKGS